MRKRFSRRMAEAAQSGIAIFPGRPPRASLFHDRLAAVAAEAGVAGATALGGQLAVIYEGATALAASCNDPRAAISSGPGCRHDDEGCTRMDTGARLFACLSSRA